MTPNTLVVLVLAGAVGAAVFISRKNQQPPAIAGSSGIAAAPSKTGAFANTVVPGTSQVGQSVGAFLSTIFSPAGAGNKPPTTQLGAPAQAPASADAVVTWTNRISSGVGALSSIYNFFSDDEE